MITQDQRPVEGFCQVSIDTGTDTVGVTLLELDPVSLKMSWRESFTLYGSLLNYRTANQVLPQYARYARLLGITQALYGYFQQVHPHQVVFEDNYLRFSPATFRSLVEAVEAVKSAIWAYNPWLPFYTIKANAAKAAVGALAPRGTPNHDKELVRKGVASCGKLAIPPDALAGMSEHAVDSVAIGICALEQLIKELTTQG